MDRGHHDHDHDHHHHHDELIEKAPASPRGDQAVPCIGVGGPVGAGKTALIEGLVPILIERGHRPIVITNDIFTQEDAMHVRMDLGRGARPATRRRGRDRFLPTHGGAR